MQIFCWQSNVLKFTATMETANPFLDVELTARFTGPNGEALVLPGYWDGGKTYCVRFAPTAVGIWRYETSASNGDPGLAASGEIVCAPYTGELPIYRHGFLHVSSDRSHLEHADGTPFLWLGDTHWTFVTEERWDESNCVQYDSQFRACVDRRAQQGFNVYQCNLREGTGEGIFGKNLTLLRETERGLLPDIDALRDVDRKMLYLAEKGFVTAVGYAWSSDISGGTEHYCCLAKYLAARYGALPVIWTLAGELPGYMPDTRQMFVDEWRKVAETAAACSPYGNLQSVHLATGDRIPDIYCGEEWLDFAMCQTGHGDYPASCKHYQEFRAEHPDVPLIESETFYEGIQSLEAAPRTVTPDVVRRMAYLLMQSGGCGYTYGCNGVWELQWEPGVGGIGWGDMGWWEGLELPGANQLTIWKKLYESVGWASLKPLGAQDIELLGYWLPFALPDAMPLLTADAGRSTIVGYFSPGAWRSFALHGLKAKSYTGYTMDPATGHKAPVTYEIKDGTLRVEDYRRTTKPDLVLVLQTKD